MGLMENTECHAAHHELLQSGITVGADDDHIHNFFLSVLNDPPSTGWVAKKI